MTPILHHIIRLVAVLSALASIAMAQDRIRGVVNAYTAVRDIIGCDSTAIVDDATAFAVGDVVLIAQMNGVRANENDGPTYGTPIDKESGGLLERLVVARIDGNRVTFTTRLVHVYDFVHAVQMVRVPVYTSVLLDGPVVARAWNGTIGGIVALEAGTLELNHPLRADSAGFRGGLRGGQRFGCYDTAYSAVFTEQRGGGKGEGAVRATLQLALRGHLFNAAGGGNGHNAGGGGGGNGGRGGHGGRTTSACTTNTDTYGQGGLATAVTVAEQRFFMGGGGGGGHENRPDFQASAGAPGGGLVYIKADVIRGNNQRISARGGSARSSDTLLEPGDGVGGGGAGGTVLLDVRRVEGSLLVDVSGGNGANNMSRYTETACGGGGGGGVVVSLTRPLTPGISTNIRGGSAGIVVSPSNPARGTSWGAIGGDDGIVLEGLEWRRPARFSFYASGEGTICPGGEATLRAAPGFVRYRWSHGATDSVVRVTAAGTYAVEATDSSGCIHRVDGLIVRDNSPSYDIPIVVDFGPCDILRTYQQSFPITNTDDEPITVSAITVPEGFTVVSPTAFPVVVDANSTMAITLAFRATADKPYGGTLTVDVAAPCAGTRSGEVRATVKPVYVTISMPDTIAAVGATAFGLPVRLAAWPDTVLIKAASMHVDVTFNNRLFAPQRVTTGTIIRDIVDVLAQRRTVTVQLDSVDIVGGSITELFRIEGVVLVSTQLATPLQPAAVVWKNVPQDPILTLEEGSLTVDPSCFPEGRPIRTFNPSSIRVTPNPASEHVRIDAEAGMPGSYTLAIVSATGEAVAEESFHVDEAAVHVAATGSTATVKLAFDVAMLPSGLYMVRYRTPVTVMVTPFVVAR